MKKILIIGIISILILTNIQICCATSIVNSDFEEKDSEKNWTYMFYDASDYNHNSMDLMLFRFITRPSSNKNFNYVVLQDTFYGPGKIFYINNLGRKNLMENLGEINMGNSSTLEYFISYCKSNYPAERYFLEIASHGTAWYASGLDDTNNHDWLTIKEIQEALTNVGGIDIMAFISSCAMAAVESVYELRNLTDVYIGCEEGVAPDPRIYNSIYSLLKKESDLSNVEIGKKIVQIVEKVENNSKLYPFPRTTISAIRTDKITDLVNGIENLTIELCSNLEDYFEEIKSVHKKTQLFFDKDLMDIYDFAKNCVGINDSNENISTYCYNIMDAVNNTVIYEYHNDLYPGSHGLTIYFPYWGGYQWIFPDNFYGKFGLDFTNYTLWDEFLVEYDNLFPRVSNDGIADYERIQDAIDNSTEGDIIYVLNGTYNENIVISKQLLLIGDSSNLPIISGDKTKDVVTITKDNTKLIYFGICNSSDEGNGIKISANSTEVRFCDIYNNSLGAYLKDSSNCKINGNNIFGNKFGIYLKNSNKNKIINNIFESNKRHVSFSNSEKNIWCNKYMNHPNRSINIILGTKDIGKISIPIIRLDRPHNYII